MSTTLTVKIFRIGPVGDPFASTSLLCCAGCKVNVLMTAFVQVNYVDAHDEEMLCFGA